MRFMPVKTTLLFPFFLLPLVNVSAQTDTYQRVDSLMATYTKKVKSTDDLRDLWYFIYQNVYTDSLRLRAAVVWMASTIAYDVKRWQSESEEPVTLNDVLKRKKAVCAGYAALLKYLCDMFRIECEIVSGRARAFDRDVYLQPSKLLDNHAWNAVKINGRWRLIDPTWVAGSVSGETDDPKAKFIPAFNETYYFTPPEKFILNHFPKQSRHQLSSPTVQEKDFLAAPLYLTPFLNADVAKISPGEELIKAAVGDTVRFRFKAASLASEMMAWSPAQKKAEYKGEATTKDGFTEFRYPVAASGFYNLYIGQVKAMRGEALVGYKLQVEPNPAAR